MPLSQLCCSQGLARVNKLQSCPSSSLHPSVPFTFVHQGPSDIKILQCHGRCAGKWRVHGREDKSDLKRAAVAVTLPWAAKAGDEELALAGSSNSHSLVDLDTFFLLFLRKNHDCTVCASSPPQGQLNKPLVVCASC